MKYIDFTSQDFALDKKFQKWVLNSDEETNIFWNDFISKHPKKQEEIAQAIEIIYLSGLSNDQEANEKFLSIWESIKTNAVINKKTGTQHRSFRFAPIAAVIAGLLIVSSLFVIYQYFNEHHLEFTTAYGEIEEVILPDGSSVTLNSNSSIIYFYKNWIPSQERLVFLEGEAFFNIVRTNDNRKFIVKTPQDVEIQVLGTEFNINSRRERTLVYLQSGKVKVNSIKEEVELAPGELASYHKTDHVMDVKKSSDEINLAWKNNLFIFDDTPLYFIAREIEDYFGLKVIISNDSLSHLKITAKVPRDHPEILFNVLSETLQVNISKKGNSFYIE